MQAIDGCAASAIVYCALRLAPLVFVRPGELRNAEWSEFNLAAAEWRIPAHKTKMRSLHIVPLSTQALNILYELQPLTGDGKYLFPSVRTASRPMSDNTINVALRRIGYAKEEICGHVLASFPYGCCWQLVASGRDFALIAKCIKGKGFRGAAAYDLQPHKCLLLETNMAGRTPRALAAEFGAIRALRPNLSKAVCHVSLSLHPEESLSDEQWCEAAHSWLQGMGSVNNQYVISRHTDAAHAHIHILVNRIALDGKVVSDAHDYRRQEKIMRELEQRFSLRQVRSSRETLRAALTKGEIEHALRTGKASTRMGSFM